MNNHYINDLDSLVRYYGSSVRTLSEFAVEHCGVPADAPEHILKNWLYSLLAPAVATMGPHFSIWDKDGIRSAIRHSLCHLQGTFSERCAKSWADFFANPISSCCMHEAPVPNWAYRDPDAPVDLTRESFADVLPAPHFGGHADVRGLEYWHRGYETFFE